MDNPEWTGICPSCIKAVVGTTLETGWEMLSAEAGILPIGVAYSGDFSEIFETPNTASAADWKAG
jgi:hypothetical protein